MTRPALTTEERRQVKSLMEDGGYSRADAVTLVREESSHSRQSGAGCSSPKSGWSRGDKPCVYCERGARIARQGAEP